MKKLLLLSLAMLFSLSSIFADYSDTDVQRIYNTSNYRDFVYFMYNNPSIDDMGEALNSVNTFIENSSYDDESKIIAKAQSLEIVGSYLVKNKTSLEGLNGKAICDYGLEVIGEIENIDKNEEALIVKAELLGNYIMISSSYIFSKGIESSKVIDKALKINKTNPRSIIIDSEKMMYAPGLFGGNKAKAKKQLEELISNYELLPKDAFEVVKNLGILAEKEGKDDIAITYFTYAKDIYPDNSEIMELWLK